MTQFLQVNSKNGDTMMLNLANANVLQVVHFDDYTYIKVLYGKYGVHITTSRTDAWALLQSLKLQSLKEPQEPQQVHKLYADTCELRYLDS